MVEDRALRLLPRHGDSGERADPVWIGLGTARRVASELTRVSSVGLTTPGVPASRPRRVRQVEVTLMCPLAEGS